MSKASVEELAVFQRGLEDDENSTGGIGWVKRYINVFRGFLSYHTQNEIYYQTEIVQK